MKLSKVLLKPLKIFIWLDGSNTRYKSQTDTSHWRREGGNFLDPMISLSSNYLNEYEINNDRYIIYILFIKINYFELVSDLFI